MRIRKRPKIPISTSDLETPPTITHATHAGGSSVSSIGAPSPVAAGGVLHLDRDLPPKSSGCNTYGSSVGGGDLILPVSTQMEGTHLKLKGKVRTEILGNFHSFNNNTNSTWDAESSFLLKKKKRGEAMEVGDEKKATKTKHSTTMGNDQNCTIDEKKSLKRKSPAVVMEGSRCSRVNGRGWRCCQQTLVGYSLCEHHLGKGRLRNINNNNIISHVKFKNNNKRKEEEGSTVETDGGFDDCEEDGMKVMISGRRRKIGIVKARSISSLLDQTISSDVNSNNVVIPPPKDEVLVAAATTRRTDQVTSSREVSSATMV